MESMWGYGRSGYLGLPDCAQDALIAGARDYEPVRGLTHGFYKYPTRFSPTFARAVIETFTRPGDVRWRLRKATEQGILSAIALGTPRLEAFGRCAALQLARFRRPYAD